MALSTLAEARRRLEEDLAPQLSDFQLKQHRQTLAEAERGARATAERYMASREEEVLGARDSALRECTAVRDELDELRNAGATGRLPAAEYAHRLHELRGRQQSAERRLAAATETAEQLAGVENDPLAWYDDLARRQPHMQVEVPW